MNGEKHDEIQIPRLLTAEDVGRLLQVSSRTLSNWRRQGVNLKFLKFGTHTIRYRPDEIDRFISEHTCRQEK